MITWSREDLHLAICRAYGLNPLAHGMHAVCAERTWPDVQTNSARTKYSNLIAGRVSFHTLQEVCEQIGLRIRFRPRGELVFLQDDEDTEEFCCVDGGAARGLAPRPDRAA